MNTNTPKALLLVGSPKGSASTSGAIGRFLLRRLEARGMAAEEMSLTAALRSGEGWDKMITAVDAADLVVVSFPLYVDQLPAPLAGALERVSSLRKARAGKDGTGREAQRLAAIVQCGFPESFQNDPAVAIMKRFAAEAGFVWAGALEMGMGGAVGGRPLEKAGGMVRNLVKALDLAASSLAVGGLVPDEASALVAKPMMPKWIYLVAANFGMRSQARKHGVGKRMYDRPYGDGRVGIASGD